eukprot:gene18591-20457_t
MERFKKVFTGSLPAIIGMIHVRSLPGTPKYGGNGMKDIILQACREAEIYMKSGIDAILIENMHDVPYLNRQVGPEIVASMTTVCHHVKSITGSTPCGIQILAGCNKEALAVAKACDLSFIRSEGFVFGHVADEGLIESDAAGLLRYRKSIEADDVLVFTDIKKKHSSHAVTNDVGLADTAKAAEFFLSDGVIVTGSHTGHPADPDLVSQLTCAVDIPVLVGSGITDKNVGNFLAAHAFIVGSYFKRNGFWRNDLCTDRIKLVKDSLNAAKRKP